MNSKKQTPSKEGILPPPAPKPVKKEFPADELFEYFKILSFDDKMALLSLIKEDCRKSWELEAKKGDEYMCRLKELNEKFFQR